MAAILSQYDVLKEQNDIEQSLDDNAVDGNKRNLKVQIKMYIEWVWYSHNDLILTPSYIRNLKLFILVSCRTWIICKCFAKKR